MAFGSGLGVELNDDVSYANLFAPSYADFVVEIPADREKEFYRIGNNDRVIPVSYTHLDVYKRQVY